MSCLNALWAKRASQRVGRPHRAAAFTMNCLNASWVVERGSDVGCRVAAFTIKCLNASVCRPKERWKAPITMTSDRACRSLLSRQGRKTLRGSCLIQRWRNDYKETKSHNQNLSNNNIYTINIWINTTQWKLKTHPINVRNAGKSVNNNSTHKII